MEYLFYLLFLQGCLEDLGSLDICITVQMQGKNVKQMFSVDFRAVMQILGSALVPGSVFLLSSQTVVKAEDHFCREHFNHSRWRILP